MAMFLLRVAIVEACSVYDVTVTDCFLCLFIMIVRRLITCCSCLGSLR